MFKQRNFIILLLGAGVLVIWSVLMQRSQSQNQSNSITTGRIVLEPVQLPAGYQGILAYFRDDNIYTLNLATGEHIRYRGVPNMANPSWHPDGQQIVFGYGAIYILNVQTGDIRNLVGSPNAPGVEMRPRWNHDGTQIIYEDSTDSSRFRLLDVSTEVNHPIVIEGIQNESDARWSPDGRRISFDANPATGDVTVDRWSQIYTIPADCVLLAVCQPTQLTHLTGSTRSTVWSPNGSQIAFVSDHDGFFAIYAANSDGSSIRRLTDNINGDFDPTWSPDGQFIAFYRQGEQNRDARIFIMRSDGSALTEILADAGGHLDWWMETTQNSTPETTNEEIVP